MDQHSMPAGVHEKAGGQPFGEQPFDGQPIHGQPVHEKAGGQPFGEQPFDGPRIHGQPMYGQPIHEKPIHEQSIVGRPAMNGGPNWSNSFWDCCSPIDLCFMGWCCPCFLFGKTQSRLKHGEISSCNVDCLGWCLMAHFGASWIYQTIKRGDMRDRYGIQGSMMGDCAGAYCCTCCALVQEEKEALLREEGIDAKTGTQYQAPAAMTYN